MSLSHSSADKASFVKTRCNPHLLANSKIWWKIVMFTVAQPMMRNFKSPLGAVSALGNPPTDRLDELRNILLAVLGMASITFAVAGFGILSPAGGVDPSESSLRVDSAGAYHYADVLEPGTRGSAVDI